MNEFKRITSLVSSLMEPRSRREGRWRELARWLCPWRGAFDEVGRSDEADMKLFTGAASGALAKGAAGMTGGMTPRNISWFKPSFSAEEMNEASGARAWLDRVDRRIKDALADGGFYQAIHNFNADLLWSGCALLYCERGRDVPLRFECVQVGAFCVATNQDGRLEAVARRVKLSAREVVRVFGEEKASRSAREKAEREPYSPVALWHVCREEAGEGSGEGLRRKEYPVKSWWFEEGAREDFLRTSSFHEMPYFFARWNDGPTPYGTGPGDEVLADARQMDILERRKLAGLGRLADPPVAAPPTLKEYLDLLPGGVNFVNPNEKISPILDLAPYAQAFRYLREELNGVRERLNEGLMASIFAAVPLEQRPRDMSATEFLERKREALQRLGPVISAYEPNVLVPVLYRTIHTLAREGLLPPAPQSLANIDLPMKVEFISPMANALRQTGAETARAFFADVAGIFKATQKPDVFDKVDLDQLVDELATGLGAPGSVVRSDEDVEKLREQRAQMEAERQAKADALEFAKAARNSPENPGTQRPGGERGAGRLGGGDLF